MNASRLQRAGIRARLDWLVRHGHGGSTLRAIAHKASVPENYLSELRSGAKQLGPRVAGRIANACGCTLEWLMKGEGAAPETTSDDWLSTYNGHRLFVSAPLVEHICIEDIAHHLSLICRFGGAARELYSVAQHSVLVSCAVPAEFAPVGLLHDATEAYLGDVIRPVKDAIRRAYCPLEKRWARVIGERFGVNLVDLPEVVHQADRAALLAERRDLTTRTPHPWREDSQGDAEALPGRVVPLIPRHAEELFLMRFRDLWAA